MQFIKKENFLCASQITGPRHNYIEIQFSTGAPSIPACECLGAIGTCKHELLSEPEIIKNVQLAVLEANEKYSKNYCVTHIRYIENDTKPEVIYGVLTSKIIDHLESGGVFNAAIKASQ